MNKILEVMMKQAERDAKKQVAIETSADEAIQQTKLLAEINSRAEAAEKGADEALAVARRANVIAVSAIIIGAIAAVLSIIVTIATAVGSNN